MNAALHDINREMGETKASVAALDSKVGTLGENQRREFENTYKRINAISIESSGAARSIDDHLRHHHHH